MTDLSTVFTPPGNTAWVYDPQHDALRFVSKANATLYTYSLTQQAFTTPLAVGGTPDSIAISPDGQTLIIGNETPVSTAAVITRVNLATQAVDWVSTVLSATNPRGVAQVAVDAKGAVIFDTLLGGFNNANDFHTFPATAVSPTSTLYAGLGPRVPGFYGAANYILSSPDHRFLLLQDPATGPSNIALYDSVFNSVIGTAGEGGDFRIEGFQRGAGDVSNTGLVVDVSGNAALVLDQQLHLIKDLKSISGGIAGAAFSQDAKELFIWVPGGGAVYALDTQTWNVVASVKATIAAGSIGVGLVSPHDMQVVGNGRFLLLNDQEHVELIDLASRLNLPIASDPTTADPVVPVLTTGSIGATEVTVSGDMDSARLSDLLPATITQADDGGFAASGPGALSISLDGYGLTYANNQLSAGTISRVGFTDVQAGHTNLVFSAHDIAFSNWSAAQFETWLIRNDAPTAFQTLLAGNDVISGGTGADLIRGYAGGDFIQGLGGADTVFGGLGDDVIYASARSSWVPVGAAMGTYLRGDEGDDYIVGGAGFDNINGNMGRDTESGGAGNDWVVGGKDDDFLSGDAGADIVNGNLGNDTCVGGLGDDSVRGGQADDMIYGGAGNDWLSGDLGNDTESGGAGADIFRVFTGDGIDRVTDFNAAEGDRVQFDPGTPYTVRQAGADTIVDLGSSSQLILVGVQIATLPAGWIFSA